MLVAGGPGLLMLTFGDELTAVEGGVPLVEHSAAIGAIGVSGMTPPEDGAVARAGARALAG